MTEPTMDSRFDKTAEIALGSNRTTKPESDSPQTHSLDVLGAALQEILTEHASHLTETEGHLEDWLKDAAGVITTEDWVQTNALAQRLGDDAAEMRANIRILACFEMDDPSVERRPPTPEEFMASVRPFIDEAMQRAFDFGRASVEDEDGDDARE